MKTPKRPTLGKIRTGFLPVSMGSASATSANAKKHSPMPGSSTATMNNEIKKRVAGLRSTSRKAKKMY